jgi:hypothetical protein
LIILSAFHSKDLKKKWEPKNNFSINFAFMETFGERIINFYSELEHAGTDLPHGITMMNP